MLNVFGPQKAVTEIFVPISNGCVAALICSLTESSVVLPL